MIGLGGNASDLTDAEKQNEDQMKTIIIPSVLIAALVIGGTTFAQTEKDTKDNKPACSKCESKTGAAGATCTAGCCSGSVEQSPVILALDLDKDGVISQLEIKNAVSSLSALDSNGDGKLSSSEIHAKSKFSQVNVPVASKLQLGVSVEYYVEKMLLKYDKNDNNQLEKSELPEIMVSMLSMIDPDKNGILTVGELLDMQSNMVSKVRRIRPQPAAASPKPAATRVRKQR